MRKHYALWGWALACLLASNPGVIAQSSGVKLVAVSRAQLCVTEGAVEEPSGQHLSVSVPKMRAYLLHRTPQSIEARFTYLAPTATGSRLGSGETRSQFGLKLRAQDACNLVYAMWRFDPEEKLVVSVKSNPGQHTSAECGNRGYRNIKPRVSRPLPALKPGETHAIYAEMIDAVVRVFVDHGFVWEGSVGPVAAALDGPVGIRSDNARLKFELRAGEPLAIQPANAAQCRSGGEETE